MGLTKEWGPWSAWIPHIDVEIRDLWVGFYWDDKIEGDTEMVDIYICIIPVFPIHLHFERSEIEYPDEEWTKQRG